MFRSWKLGRAFGIDLYVHWTLLLLIVGLALSNLPTGGVAAGVYVAVLFAAVFGCVLLHEFGHALMARAYGIPTRDITLYPIGGVARLERMSERPLEEFCIAVAGPAVNAGIAIGLAGLLLVTGGPVLPSDTGSSLLTGRLMVDLLGVNVALVLFNLLPAFPMDGGRVFRALLAYFTGHRLATEIAAAVGAVVAVLLGTVGLLVTYNPMLILVASFVFFAGRQELAAVRQREYQRRMVPEVVPASFYEVPEVIPVEVVPPFSGLVWDDRNRAWVVWQNGRPV